MSTAYDPALFQQHLDDLGEKLGELRGIDAALEMLKKIDDDYLRDAETDPGSHGDFEVRLGRTHPFGYRPLVPSDQIEEASGQIIAAVKVYAQSGGVWGQAEVAAVRQRVPHVVEPHVGTIGDLASSLETQVSAPLETRLVGNFAEIEIGDFEGATADQFGFYYAQLVKVSENQAKLATDIGNSIAAAAAVVGIGQRSLMAVAETALRVVEEQLKQRQETHTPDAGLTVKQLLSAATLLTGLVSLVPGVGTGVKVAEKIVGYAAREVSPWDGAPKREIKAKDAEQLAASLHEEVGHVLRSVDAGWDELLADRVAHIRAAAGRIVASEVGLDAHPAPRDFHHHSVTY